MCDTCTKKAGRAFWHDPWIKPIFTLWCRLSIPAARDRPPNQFTAIPAHMCRWDAYQVKWINIEYHGRSLHTLIHGRCPWELLLLTSPNLWFRHKATILWPTSLSRTQWIMSEWVQVAIIIFGFIQVSYCTFVVSKYVPRYLVNFKHTLLFTCTCAPAGGKSCLNLKSNVKSESQFYR